MKEEIAQDFKKLSWAVESGQTDNVYLIIFNRARKEEDYCGELKGLKKQYPEVKGIYLESVFGYDKRFYTQLYLNKPDWKYRIKS